MANGLTAESNEARLVEIARAHVRKFGHARTTVVGVAADAGMTHANVYRYFPSKTALLDEVVASGLRPLEARLREAAEGADPAYDKLERMLLAVHRDYRMQARRRSGAVRPFGRRAGPQPSERAQASLARANGDPAGLRGGCRLRRLRHDRPAPRDVADLRRRAPLHPSRRAPARPRQRAPGGRRRASRRCWRSR